MKILTIGSDRKIFEEGLPPGRAGGQGSAVAARQVKYGALFKNTEMIVYAKRSLGLKRKRLSPNVTAYPTNSWSRFLYFIDAVRIARRLEKPDIVSAQDPFESGVAAYLCSRYWGVPLHLQVHTDFLSPYFVKGSTLNKIRVFLARFLIRRAGAVRVVTERIKRSILDAGLIEAGRITVLPVFVDTEKIRNAPIRVDLHKKYPQFDTIILMASRLVKEKNIGLAIEAMREIVKPAPTGASGKHPRVGLIIVGDGPEGDNLKFKIKNAKLEENIIFEKWSNDLASYYKTADLFLLTSNYEGYGMTVIEALSAGLPVVMSNVGVAGEVLRHKENGLVFEVGDLCGLIASLERFISDPNLRASIKKNVDNFGLGSNEAKYLLEYRDSFDISTQ